MTTPTNPSVDPLAPPTPSPAGQGDLDTEIRRLAQSLAPKRVDGMVATKGTVTAVALGDASTPPTLTCTLSGSGVSVADIQIASNFTPVVGDTVSLIVQNNSYLAVWRVAVLGSKSSIPEGGWLTPVLATGYTQGAADFRYRRVMDNGAWKMQWKGYVNLGAGDAVLGTNLIAEYRPSTWRPVHISQQDTGVDGVTARCDFDVDGSLTLFFAGTRPGWVSLNGVEYFL